MATNLLKNGKNVIVFDLNKGSVDHLKGFGASSAESPAEVASQAKTLITMLPSSPHVQKVYMQDSGIFSQVGVGSLLIDCSTIDPEVARDVARISREKGVRFVDAPVSGGTIGAQNATLTFMVGALAKDFEEASQVLQLMGKNVLHCGEPGNGQVAKLCNNLILGITMAGVSEAFNLGKRMGMDPKVLADVVNCSSGRSWSSDTYNPCPGVMEGVPSAREYSGGFACDLMIKDLSLATSAGFFSKSPLPMGAAAQQIYSVMSSQGNGHKDFSGVYQLLERDEPGKK
mmetsp:Transcript_4450/g.7166  ORF Transcript_4450/g.7166 Transcript_4450/m.7166 type:complete len:286 (+) Transcript_4450:803-1660(+)|eukprot:CAMPEP_0184291550 /NCGR_PEP_ID=MMETSP1049-20130417/3545_1 /TAXON_ID=77928 /ORGANISM="Proteomonas sulcata, Strain CCMP704" /LENGTH=285 /DNA_ID=CAMNT_0026599033 /DNA_START=777 /DNA_END=1634 /DNA_ORIENTATION=-